MLPADRSQWHLAFSVLSQEILCSVTKRGRGVGLSPHSPFQISSRNATVATVTPRLLELSAPALRACSADGAAGRRPAVREATRRRSYRPLRKKQQSQSRRECVDEPCRVLPCIPRGAPQFPSVPSPLLQTGFSGADTHLGVRLGAMNPAGGKGHAALREGPGADRAFSPAPARSFWVLDVQESNVAQDAVPGVRKLLRRRGS